MEKQELLSRIDKIFRANTIEVEVPVGQFGQTELKKQISDIQELKDDIKELISKEFKVGKLNKKSVFIGTGKVGASYPLSEAIKIAKEWGFAYVSWNGGEIFNLKGDPVHLKYDEL